jgi:HlyD family secretion protein
MSRALWAALVLAIITGAGAVYWRRADSDAAHGFVTLEVDRGTIAASVSATGTVNPVTQVQVGTYVSGPILAIYADFNAPVKKGQLVAKIDPASFAVKVSQAEANLANARARVEKDRADLEFQRSR